ncbi:MAG: hypothetical protein ACE5HV_14255, partial [Acidobacteriota bacterium]
DTGGKPFFGSDKGLGFRDVLEDSRLRYVIGFLMDPEGAAAADQKPRWHELKIHIRRPGLEVRAREGFFWPTRS